MTERPDSPRDDHPPDPAGDPPAPDLDAAASAVVDGAVPPPTPADGAEVARRAEQLAAVRARLLATAGPEPAAPGVPDPVDLALRRWASEQEGRHDGDGSTAPEAPLVGDVRHIVTDRRGTGTRPGTVPVAASARRHRGARAVLAAAAVVVVVAAAGLAVRSTTGTGTGDSDSAAESSAATSPDQLGAPTTTAPTSGFAERSASAEGGPPDLGDAPDAATVLRRWEEGVLANRADEAPADPGADPGQGEADATAGAAGGTSTAAPPVAASTACAGPVAATARVAGTPVVVVVDRDGRAIVLDAADCTPVS